MEASKIAGEIANQLPLQMSQDMVWESVSAVENTIQGHLTLSYDQITFEKYLAESESNMEQARSSMRQAANMVCNHGSPTHLFINQGGAMRYVYSFSNGEKFLTVDIENCE
ncbi:MAG: hypothetical protein ACR2QW_03635 [bacterium]